MITDKIIQELFVLRDEKYRELQKKIIPTADPESFIGVRTPDLRALAKRMLKDKTSDRFLEELPHRYFDENQLHAFIISEIKDFDLCVARLQEFLPYVDNWATCDQMSPKVFIKNRDALPSLIKEWLSSGRVYTVRFAIGMLMQHFLGDGYDPSYPEAVARIRSDEYYVNMMIAWYFATALAKRYEDALPFLEERKLDPVTHNMTIRKAIESYRISPDRKEYLRSLKISKNEAGESALTRR